MDPDLEAIPVLECLERSDKCLGVVSLHSIEPGIIRAFPRCEHHWEQRLQAQEHINELTSDVPPAWFDPSYAGERWSEEDY